MEPLKSNAEVRKSARLALRRQPSADPYVAIRNVTGILGHPPEGNPNDGEIGPNDIIMKTEAESEVKLEYDSTIISTIETSCASCSMDVCVEKENWQVVKTEPLENVLVEGERDIPVDEVALIDRNLQQEEATECCSGEREEHWCVWRKKFTEMQKKLEMVEEALTIVKSVLAEKQQDNSRSEDASRKKRPRMEAQLPVVVDEMVSEERVSQQLDTSHQETSTEEALVIDQNQDSEDTLAGMTRVMCQNKVGLAEIAQLLLDANVDKIDENVAVTNYSPTMLFSPDKTPSNSKNVKTPMTSQETSSQSQPSTSGCKPEKGVRKSGLPVKRVRRQAQYLKLRFPCRFPGCDKLFAYQESVLNHLRIKHSAKSSRKPGRPLKKCSSSATDTNTSADFVLVEKGETGLKSDDSFGNHSSEDNIQLHGKDKTKVKTQICIQCGSKFSYRAGLVFHMRKVHGIEPTGKRGRPSTRCHHCHKKRSRCKCEPLD